MQVREVFHLEQFVTLLEYDPKVGFFYLRSVGGIFLMRVSRSQRRTIRLCFKRCVMLVVVLGRRLNARLV